MQIKITCPHHDAIKFWQNKFYEVILRFGARFSCFLTCNDRFGLRDMRASLDKVFGAFCSLWGESCNSNQSMDLTLKLY